MSEFLAAYRLIRRDDHVLVPWRNGGGVTREIARQDNPAGALGYGWRLSQATVSEPGAFSIFPHCDRTLLVLSGEGLKLTVAGETHLLTTGGYLPFPGDCETHGEPLAGPVEDLNIICDRRRVRHGLWVAAAGERVDEAADELLVVALGEPVTVTGYPTLAPGDTLWITGAGALSVSAPAAIIALWSL